MVVLSIVAVLVVAFSTISAAPTDDAAKAALSKVTLTPTERKEIKAVLQNKEDLIGPLVQIGEVFTQAKGGNVEEGVSDMVEVMQNYAKVVPALIALSQKLIETHGHDNLHAQLQKVAQALKDHSSQIEGWVEQGKEVGHEEMAKKLKDHKDAAVLPAVIALSQTLIQTGHENVHEALQTVAEALQKHEKVIPGLAAVGEGFTQEGATPEEMQAQLGALGQALEEHGHLLPKLGALGVEMKKAHPKDVHGSYKALAQLLE